MRDKFLLLLGVFLGHIHLVECLPTFSNYDTSVTTKHWRYRKLPNYNCSELFSVADSDVERIHTGLKELKAKKFDLVVLNYTVNLDCLFDSEMKYVRHFIVTPKGKNILRYAVEAQYFPLKVFGLKSTILNVNVTPVAGNNSHNVQNVYTLENLTYISVMWTSDTGFEDVCVTSKVEEEWSAAMYLFVPKHDIFYKNNIICHQAGNRKSDLDSSGLVYAVYILCLFVCLHLNLLYDLVSEEINQRKYGWKVYYKDETPFSFARFPCIRCFAKPGPLRMDRDKEDKFQRNCSLYFGLAVSVPVAIGYYAFTHEDVWRTHVVFIDDYSTLKYIKDTYTYSDNFIDFERIVEAFYYLYLLLFWFSLYVFFDSLKQYSMLFSLFKPKNVFTHEYRCTANVTNGQRSAVSHLAKSYSQLFSCAFWAHLFRTSFDVPNSASWRFVKLLNTNITQSKQYVQLLGICLFTALALLEKPLLILCALINLFINVSFTLIQTFFPVLKYFFTGYASRLHTKDDMSAKIAYSLYGFVAYSSIWIVATVFIFNPLTYVMSYLLYVTVIAIPFNPTYGVPLMAITLSLVYYLLMFYTDFQSDYKDLLDIIFEILDDHLLKKDSDIELSSSDMFDLKVSNKVRAIDMKLFDSLSKKHITYSRKCAFLFIKLAFTGMCLIIAFNALEEAGTNIATLKLSDFFSVILLVMIPGIFRYFTEPREKLRKKFLYFEVFKYLKKLDRNNELEGLVKWDSWSPDVESSDDDDNNSVNDETNELVCDANRVRSNTL